MVLNATFNNISDISSMTVNFIGGGNQNTWRKTVTDKLYQVILYQVHLAMSWIHTHSLSGDIGSGKSNYHTLPAKKVNKKR
jgi:hypothetical protein